MRYSLLAVAAALPAALAEIVITDPNGLTKCTGGQQCQVKWNNGQKLPALADCGVCDFSVYVGNAQQQTRLQTISPDVNVAATAALVFTIDPTIGANSNAYFIRAQCPIQDPADPTLPLLAFSHMFTLEGMAGTFNASVLAQINGVPATNLPGGHLEGGAVSTPATTPPTNTKAGLDSSPKPSSTNVPDNSAVVRGASQGFFLAAGAAVLSLIV